MVCNSCREVKARLNERKSHILSGVVVYVCDTCEEAGYEPRWAVILGARTLGIEAVRDYVVNHKYVGKDITGSELVV